MTDEPIRVGKKRRQLAYYLSLGMLSYQDDKMTCSSMKQLIETVGLEREKGEGVIRKMMRDGELRECPDHPGRYDLTPEKLRELGLRR